MTPPTLSRSLAIFSLVAHTAVGVAADAPMETVWVEPPAEAERLAATAVRALAPAASLAAAEEVATAELAAMRQWNAAGRVPERNGFARAIAPVVELRSDDVRRRVSGALAGGVAEALPEGGMLWTGRLRVEGADRLRAGLLASGDIAGLEMLVAGSDGGPIGPFPLRPRSDGRFWTPSVAGPQIDVQLRVPESSSGRWEIAIDQVVQIFPSPLNEPCLEDAACHDDGDWPGLVAARRAIASLHFMDGSSSKRCTGGLLADTDPTTTVPYLLTANHCISTQESADSLETYWDLVAPACGAAAPALATLPRVDGATLLATSVQTDFAFLRLSAMPPGERTLLGWTTAPVAPGTPIARLSHPQAKALKFSTTTATVVAQPQCSTDEEGRPWGDQGKFRYQQLLFGGAAAGSSGAPQFLADGVVVGQLLGWCGSSYEDLCDPALSTVDGRFDVTYAAIAAWLDPAGAPGPCVADDDTLCIDHQHGDRRFAVETAFVANAGSGPARAVALDPLGIARGGLFWFFAPDNPELLVKVLDGCGLNGHFWVFASAGTDVGVTVTVTDTLSGRTWARTHVKGTAMPPIQDTSALPCD
jgi:hypothetical protein